MTTRPLPSVLGIPVTAAPVTAVVRPPGSKSLTNRALVAAALAGGTSRLDGALVADDTEAMVGCLRALGFGVEMVAPEPVGHPAGPDAREWRAGGVTMVVTGAGGRIPVGEATLDVRQSGTTARFVAPVVALGEGTYVIDGDDQMRARPMGPLVTGLRMTGAGVSEHGAPGHLPLAVRGGARGRVVEVTGDASSQFLSGLLLAAPALPDGLEIVVTTELVSRPYVELTTAVMAAFGVTVAVDAGGRRYRVAPQSYRATAFPIEPDASAASYFFAAAAITGGSVRVEGLGDGALQGDARFADVLAAMGCTVTRDADGTTVSGPSPGGLRGVDIDLADLSDTAPTLAVVAAFAATPTAVRGIGFIRHKESDRIAAIVAELRRAGVAATEHADGFSVRPGDGAPHGARFRSYDDHRMAMAFALVGLRVDGVEIADPGCVAKTFPEYFDALAAVASW